MSDKEKRVKSSYSGHIPVKHSMNPRQFSTSQLTTALSCATD